MGVNPIRIKSAAEQVADHLRQEIHNGGIESKFPGVHKLAAALGVNHKTVTSALQLLCSEGVLVARGLGRRYGISPRIAARTSPMRIGILLYDPADRSIPYMVDVWHQLDKAGHRPVHLPKTLTELGMHVPRIARMIGRSEADAWLVMAGSREVLCWFAESGMPVMALFGRRRGLPIANVGPDMPPAMGQATRALLELGHRRIVLLARQVRRLPVPGATEQAFLDELAANGITPGPYHLPEWNDTPEGLLNRLESLFRMTPPTALIVDEPTVFSATRQFLAVRGLRVPHDVSLICTDWDPSFDWCRPTVAHMRWDSRPVVRRILQWAEQVSQGRIDLRQTTTSAEFITGGTIGPVNGQGAG